LVADFSPSWRESQIKETRMNRVGLFSAALFLFTGAAHATPSPTPQSASALSVAVRPADPGQESVPRLVQFNGTLKDQASHPVTGAASVTFAIYAEQDGGTALWSETQNVLADLNGHYNVLLGAASANGGVPADLFGTASGQARWLGVTIAREPEQPRVLLASVPYALRAADADTLGGLPASAYVTAQSLAARPTTTVVATGAASSAPATDSASTITQSAQSSATNSVTQATPTGGGTANFIPLWTSTTNLGNSKLFQSAGGNIGVNTTSPAVLLDVNGDSIFRGSFQLVPQGTATATTGQPSHSYQWEASTFNSSTSKAVTTAFGFRATPIFNNTANPTSSLDLYYGPGGGTLTDTGLSISNTGIISFLPNQTFPGASVSVNRVLLPGSTSTSSGVLEIGGAPFLADYGDSSNVFLGGFAGGQAQETSASALNTAAGFQAMPALTSGGDNAAFGGQSMFKLTTGTFNSALGWDALGGATTGSNNVGVGIQTGSTNATGFGNTLLGALADTTVDGLSNATAIGQEAKVGASNALVLGGIGSNAVNVGIGTPTPQSMLELNSAVSSVGNRVPPEPAVTLTNTAGGAAARVSLDFNTSAPAYGAGYNPGSRILVQDEGGFTDAIVFQANTQGEPNQGLKNTMTIAANGNVEIFGNLQVDGTVAKSGGSFKIDDPIAPTEKYLSHSFVESPDMLNIYNGNVVTDANGLATVEMPRWFEALNGDFRYQLTTVGQFAQAMIASEIKDGKFTIQTDKPNVKISWMVTGVRHDAWANAHRIPTEEEKPADEQGRYMHPELFGATPVK
jgi:trimeric autotransporter adhesin